MPIDHEPTRVRPADRRVFLYSAWWYLGETLLTLREYRRDWASYSVAQLARDSMALFDLLPCV